MLSHRGYNSRLFIFSALFAMLFALSAYADDSATPASPAAPAAGSTTPSVPDSGSAVQAAALQVCQQGLSTDTTNLDKISSAGLGNKCKQSIAALRKDIKACGVGASKAGTSCIANQSPALAKGSSGLSSAMGGMGNVGGQIGGTCGLAQMAGGIASIASAEYQAECGPAISACESPCKKVSDDITNAESACNSEAAKDPSDSTAAGLLGSVQQAPADCIASCESYQGNMANIGSLLPGLAQMMSGAENCMNQASNGAGTGATPSGTPPVDCTNSANMNNLACICLGNPGAPGCGSTAATDGSTQAGVAASGLGTSPLADGNLAPTDAGTIAAAASPGGNLPPGSGGGFGGAGSSPGTGNEKSNAKTPLMAAAAGGGGFGAAEASGGSGSKNSGWADSKFGKYLPTSKERSPASIDVTGKAGQSNWDKVRKTYVQMSPNLMK
jgi:hypothetical protein